MQAPSSNRNITLQLLMGEGKSSVAIPLLAPVLADGNRLVRIVVLKPLVRQMFDLLFDRLTGLANRRIQMLPFSRDVKPDARTLDNVRNLYEASMKDGAVIIAQPEHVLSTQLLTVDRLLSQSAEAAHAALSLHRFLHRKARDVLDESDEILHPRYQLIYTMGTQSPIPSGQRRWQLIQDVLGLIKTHARYLAPKYAKEERLVLQFNDSTSFPAIKASRAEDSAFITDLLDQVLEDCFKGDALSGLNLTRLGNSEAVAARRFVLGYESSERVQKTLATGRGFDLLLLMRGLFGHSFSILEYIMCERRWRVDYGLDLTRSSLAVPFRAKDLPAARAEFGHSRCDHQWVLRSCMR